MCAIKRRQKWNGQIKTLLLHEYCFHNNRHINSGVSKPRLLPVLNILLLLGVKSLCGVRKVFQLPGIKFTVSIVCGSWVDKSRATRTMTASWVCFFWRRRAWAVCFGLNQHCPLGRDSGWGTVLGQRKDLGLGLSFEQSQVLQFLFGEAQPQVGALQACGPSSYQRWPHSSPQL